MINFGTKWTRGLSVIKGNSLKGAQEELSRELPGNLLAPLLLRHLAAPPPPSLVLSRGFALKELTTLSAFAPPLPPPPSEDTNSD